jgi:hypothetical protein
VNNSLKTYIFDNKICVFFKKKEKGKVVGVESIEISTDGMDGFCKRIDKTVMGLDFFSNLSPDDTFQ